jgi:hypothetical protein
MHHSNLPLITADQIIHDLAPYLLANRQSAVILSAPGLGKTSTMRQLPAVMADHFDVDPDEVAYVEFHAADRDPVEINGLALPKKDGNAPSGISTAYSRSPLLDELLATGKQYITLVVDEITQASPDMQKALRHLVESDTRMLGGEKLDALGIEVLVILAGNRLADKAGSARLLSHFSNAVMRFEMRFDIDSWVGWAEGQNINPLLIGCARAQHENGLFVDAVPAEDVQFCTPRTFSKLNEVLAPVTMRSGAVAMTPWVKTMCEAWIGSEATDMVVNYLALHDKLPSKQDILSQPESALLPDDTSIQFAAAQLALSVATDADTADAALKYVLRMRTDLTVSFGAALLRKSHREGFLLTGPTASQFVAKHYDLLPLAHK